MVRRTPVRILVLSTLLMAAVAVGPPLARAQEDAPDSDGSFISAGSFLCTLVYSPLKIAYAASGIAIGSLAWVWSFGNRRVARPIFKSSVGGDYVVTPAHLGGKRPLRFIGRQ
jgi:hypothetical protein